MSLAGAVFVRVQLLDDRVVVTGSKELLRHVQRTGLVEMLSGYDGETQRRVDFRRKK